MLPISKISIGIRPSSKMFRITSLGGNIIDDVLGMRGGKIIHDEYFSEVSRNLEQGQISLKDEKGSNMLYISMDNILFTKDYYESDKKLNLKTALKEFSELWHAVNATLKMKDIRRLGIVAEHRFSTKKDCASKLLLEKYTTLSSDNHPAKFTLRYEDRRKSKGGLIPDVKKSNFVNVIRDYYDSEIDTENPEEDCINANVDVQQYYSPLLNGSVNEELTKLQKIFEEERKKLGEELKGKGII